MLLLPIMCVPGAGKSETEAVNGFRIVQYEPHVLFVNTPIGVFSGIVSTKRLYSINAALDPAIFQIAPELRLEVKIQDAGGAIGAKTLHVGDPDLTLLLRPRKEGPLRIDFSPSGRTAESELRRISLKIVEWRPDADSIRNVAY